MWIEELTPVSLISVDYACTNQSATVYWSPVFAASSYNATATSGSGAQLMCSSQSTSCVIRGLTCGQSYVVNVMPISGNCKNTANTTSATFQTGETKISLSHMKEKKNTKWQKERQNNCLRRESIRSAAEPKTIKNQAGRRAERWKRIEKVVAAVS